MMRQWRTWTVPGIALLVVAASFCPWFYAEFSTMAALDTAAGRHGATAWEASTRWSGAVLIAGGVGLAWLAARRFFAESTRWVAAGLALVAGVAVAMTVSVWSEWQPEGPPIDPNTTAMATGVVVSGSGSGAGAGVSTTGGIVRDDLWVLRYGGVHRDFDWGFFLGTGLLSLLVVVLVLFALLPTRAARN
ncbi:hypothetical protein [Longispora urticae]